MEPIETSTQILNEIEILPKLEGCPGVPLLLFHGSLVYQNKMWRAIGIDVIGKFNLKQIASKEQWNEQTASVYALLCIEILKSIHSRGVLYVDVKPEHFVVQEDKLYLVDYGSSRLLNKNYGPYFVTPKYCSMDYYLDIPVV